MHEFTIAKLNKLGADDPTYGQKYWASVHESQMPVSFNSKQQIAEGQKIQCEEYSVKKSAKGTDYQQLKKVRVVGSQPTGTTAKKEWQPRDDEAIRAQWAIGQAVGVYGDKVDEVEVYAKTLFSMVDRVKKGKEEPKQEKFSDGTPVPDEVVEDFDESEPINLNDIPF